MDNLKEKHRKGRKARLWLSVPRKKRKTFPLKKITKEESVSDMQERQSLVAYDGPVLEGRRVVNINSFLKSIADLSAHNTTFGCTLANLIAVKEERTGLISTIQLKCNLCNEVFKLRTAEDDVNKDAVLGIMAIGSGFAHLEQFTAALDIPCMSARMYDQICNAREQEAVQTMKEAASEEKAEVGGPL